LIIKGKGRLQNSEVPFICTVSPSTGVALYIFFRSITSDFLYVKKTSVETTKVFLLMEEENEQRLKTVKPNSIYFFLAVLQGIFDNEEAPEKIRGPYSSSIKNKSLRSPRQQKTNC